MRKGGWERQCSMNTNGVFTTETETDTEPETEKMAEVPNGIGVLVQYKHLHTILYKLFLIELGIGLDP